MERKSFNLTVSELTLSAIIRVLADYLEPKGEDSSSWNLIRDDLYATDKQECLKQILAVLDYVNPPLYGLLLASVHDVKFAFTDKLTTTADLLAALLSDGDEEEEGDDDDADA